MEDCRCCQAHHLPNGWCTCRRQKKISRCFFKEHWPCTKVQGVKQTSLHCQRRRRGYFLAVHCTSSSQVSVLCLGRRARNMSSVTDSFGGSLVCAEPPDWHLCSEMVLFWNKLAAAVERSWMALPRAEPFSGGDGPAMVVGACPLAAFSSPKFCWMRFASEHGSGARRRSGEWSAWGWCPSSVKTTHGGSMVPPTSVVPTSRSTLVTTSSTQSTIKLVSPYIHLFSITQRRPSNASGMVCGRAACWEQQPLLHACSSLSSVCCVWVHSDTVRRRTAASLVESWLPPPLVAVAVLQRAQQQGELMQGASLLENSACGAANAIKDSRTHILTKPVY